MNLFERRVAFWFLIAHWFICKQKVDANSKMNVDTINGEELSELYAH